MGGLKKRRFLCATLLFASAAAFADRPPQHAELRMAINLGKYDQAREYIKQDVKDIYCGDMPADSAKAVWAKRWKQNPELALTGCLPQYTHFYPEKACEIRGVSPNICPGRLKDSTALADSERFAALAKAALSNPEHKTRLRGEIATLGEERLITLADEAGFDFVRDSVLPEKMAAWAGMLRDLQRKFKLFGDGVKDYYPGSEKWMKSERARERITSYRKRKAAADAGPSEKLLQKASSRGDVGGQTVHILKIVEVVDYTPTGRRVVVYSDGAPTTPQFTGKEMDAETGLYHFGARQYDPELAMWAQVDPGRQFASPYAYAGNGVNPINGVDPDGEDFMVSNWIYHNIPGEKRDYAYGTTRYFAGSPKEPGELLGEWLSHSGGTGKAIRPGQYKINTTPIDVSSITNPRDRGWRSFAYELLSIFGDKQIGAGGHGLFLHDDWAEPGIIWGATHGCHGIIPESGTADLQQLISDSGQDEIMLFINKKGED
ncbi:MAG: RHS repeat-associated core domain-containing protein [Fibrobacterales bacterium]|nr:RHS repeat-associated core domain-containing protein [Fibrobacterales bacterium]